MSMSFRQLPNLISLIRIALVVPIAAALINHQWPSAILLFLAAAFSDAADGFLAKRYDWQTELGALLDPAADKLLLATVFVILAIQSDVPVWLMATAVGRDVVIVSGALLYRSLVGPLRMRPTVISKINTLCQLLFIMCVVARQGFGSPPAWAITLLGALVFVTAATSGLDYVLTYLGLALRTPHHKREPS